MTSADSLIETFDCGGLRISFDERVLRPRPWTLAQSLWAEGLLGRELPEGPVLELCSGAGQIGLRGVRGSRRRLVCVDADPVAASYAVANAVVAQLLTAQDVTAGELRTYARGVVLRLDRARRAL